MNHAHATLDVSPWIARFASLVAPGARVLDLACGHGRHARWFASRGADVLALDRDPATLASLHGVPGVTTRVADLEGAAWPFAGERFDAIAVTNYLHRPLFAPMLQALAGDGVLLYETFAAGNEKYGRPSNPAFLLQPGELLQRLDGLTIVAFEQGRSASAVGAAVVQRIAAVGRDFAWPPPLWGSPA